VSFKEFYKLAIHPDPAKYDCHATSVEEEKKGEWEEEKKG